LRSAEGGRTHNFIYDSKKQKYHKGIFFDTLKLSQTIKMIPIKSKIKGVLRQARKYVAATYHTYKIILFFQFSSSGLVSA
jgi:hypothetical protein